MTSKRDNRIRELDVLRERELRVVAATDRVRCGDDRAAGGEARDDARLRDRDRLLLHRLVDRRPILVVHLVELVDEADAGIGENERAAFERPLPGLAVLHHGRRKADPGRALARRVDRPLERLADVLQALALGQPRVPQDEHVDVPADAVLPRRHLRDAAEHRRRERALHVRLAVDRRRDRLDDLVVDLGVPRELQDLLDVRVGICPSRTSPRRRMLFASISVLKTGKELATFAVVS